MKLLAIFAAASLTGVFPLIDRAPKFQFAGSDQLAFQITQGAPADVFAAASPEVSGAALRAGASSCSKPAAFATNTVVLIVPRANPARIHSVYDLTRDGIKLVIGAKGVPIGDYTRKLLANLGLSSALKNVVSEEDDVKLVVAKVALGEADAGFVYRTDVKPVGNRRFPHRGARPGAADRAVRALHSDDDAASAARGCVRARGAVEARAAQFRCARRACAGSAVRRLFRGLAAAVALTFLALPVLAIFLRVSPTTLVHELSDPVARDALVVSLTHERSRAGARPRARHADRVPARDAALPRPQRAADGGRAAARAPARGGGDRAARRLRAHGPPLDVGSDSLHAARGRAGDRVRLRAVLRPDGRRVVRGARPHADRGGAHPRRGTRRVFRRVALPLAAGGLGGGLGARVRARARRVRRDDHVRRLAAAA